MCEILGCVFFIKQTFLCTFLQGPDIRGWPKKMRWKLPTNPSIYLKNKYKQIIHEIIPLRYKQIIHEIIPLRLMLTVVVKASKLLSKTKVNSFHKNSAQI